MKKPIKKEDFWVDETKCYIVESRIKGLWLHLDVDRKKVWLDDELELCEIPTDAAGKLIKKSLYDVVFIPFIQQIR